MTPQPTPTDETTADCVRCGSRILIDRVGLARHIGNHPADHQALALEPVLPPEGEDPTIPPAGPIDWRTGMLDGREVAIHRIPKERCECGATVPWPGGMYGWHYTADGKGAHFWREVGAIDPAEGESPELRDRLNAIVYESIADARTSVNATDLMIDAIERLVRDEVEQAVRRVSDALTDDGLYDMAKESMEELRAAPKPPLADGEMDRVIR